MASRVEQEPQPTFTFPEMELRSDITELALITAFGAVLASFVTTAAMRSVEGRSWAWGRSACDSCGTPVGFGQAVPVLSFAALRGRCGSCKEPIDWRHPVGEFAGAAIAATAMLTTHGWALWLMILLGFALLLVSLVDLATLRIPDALSLIVLGLCLALALSLGSLWEGVLTGIATSAILYGLRVAFRARVGREGLGLGDVKLFSALAVGLGPTLSSLALAVAALMAMGFIRAKGRSAMREEKLPFGPFLGASAWLTLTEKLASC